MSLLTMKSLLKYLTRKPKPKNLGESNMTENRKGKYPYKQTILLHVRRVR